MRDDHINEGVVEVLPSMRLTLWSLKVLNAIGDFGSMESMTSLEVATSRNKSCTQGRGMTVLTSVFCMNMRREAVILLSSSVPEVHFK